MRASLLARVREMLARAGYFLSAEAGARPQSFDLAARRDGELLLAKVLTNVDGLTESVAQELRLIARYLDAAPVVVGERSSSRALEDGAVYVRYGVSIVTLETLREYMEEGVAPLVYAAPGGFYVNLDGKHLRRLREERGLSLGDLAQAAGVSRRAIGMYEEGMGAMVEVAMRIESFLGEPLAVPANPFRASYDAPLPADDAFEPRGGLEGIVLRRMSELGFRVAATSKSPFAAISREEAEPGRHVVLTGVADEPTADIKQRAAATANLCEVTETFGVFFVERTTTRLAVEGTPVVSREELAGAREPEDLLEILRARRGRAR
jgi:putative transcriptional regulator